MKAELHALSGELMQLRRRITNYKLKPDKNEEYLAWMLKLEATIAAVVNSKPEQQACPNKELIQIIKKQALIIEAAGIKYPTINQSMGQIADVYHASTGQAGKIGTIPTQINIGII